MASRVFQAKLNQKIFMSAWEVLPATRSLGCCEFVHKVWKSG